MAELGLARSPTKTRRDGYTGKRGPRVDRALVALARIGESDKAAELPDRALLRRAAGLGHAGAALELLRIEANPPREPIIAMAAARYAPAALALGKLSLAAKDQEAARRFFALADRFGSAEA